jgi:hypothetical protein
MIEHKISQVPDEVCHGTHPDAPHHSCPQLYEGECEAHLTPHSEAERKHRMQHLDKHGRPTANCDLYHFAKRHGAKETDKYFGRF